MARALGIVECNCLADIAFAAGLIVKTAAVRLICLVHTAGPYMALAVEGELSEVERALETAKTRRGVLLGPGDKADRRRPW